MHFQKYAVINISFKGVKHACWAQAEGVLLQILQEARERVRAAIRNAGFTFPLRRITVNLAPPTRRKVGTALDVAMALAILVADGQVAPSG